MGYANDDPETGHLPPAVWLARRIARALRDLRLARGAGQVGPDGKVLVTVERTGCVWRPVSVSISLHHHEASDWLLLRELAERAVARACGDREPPVIALNAAGMFVAGGPNGDNGLSGKKLVADAYGPSVPIGGGAWSGKDLRKVDRLGGLLARELAVRAAQVGLGREVQVTLNLHARLRAAGRVAGAGGWWCSRWSPRAGRRGRARSRQPGGLATLRPLPGSAAGLGALGASGRGRTLGTAVGGDARIGG